MKRSGEAREIWTATQLTAIIPPEHLLKVGTTWNVMTTYAAGKLVQVTNQLSCNGLSIIGIREAR